MPALLVVRTPFQAFLAQKIIKKENINNFDIVYFTHNNSEEDQNYYNELALKSKRSKYIFVKPKRFDILSHLCFRIKVDKYYRDKKYSTVIFANINALVPNSLVSKHKKAELITFDDGAANIFKTGSFYNEPKSLRFKTYQFIMRASTLETIKKRISRHYTIYKTHGNIVEDERLRYIDTFSRNEHNESGQAKTYFIAAPFEEIMSQEQIERLESYVKKLKIDFYVTHPRERKVLNIDASILEKQGLIAEEAIISDANSSPIILVGWFSTVMLNMESICESRIVLLPKESPQTPELFALSKKAGCTPILI